VSYRVEFTDSAERELDRLHPTMRHRVRARLDALADQPRPRGVVALKGDLHGLWRLRVGDCRVVYEMDDRQETLTIAAIGHRGAVYR